MGYIRDVLANGDDETFIKYTIYPFIEIMWMMVRIKENDKVLLDEYKVRKARQESERVKQEIKNKGKR